MSKKLKFTRHPMYEDGTPVKVWDKIKVEDPAGEFVMTVILIASRTFEDKDTWKIYGYDGNDEGLQVGLEGYLYEYLERAE